MVYDYIYCNYFKDPTQVKVVSASVETGDVDISNMELEEILKKIGITKYKIQQMPEGIVINVE